MNMPLVRAPLRYPGAKWTLARKITEHFGEHVHYVEPFFGSGAVFFTKDASRHEVINDRDHNVVNFFRVLRDQPDELTDLLRLTPWAREEYAQSTFPSDDELESARRFVVRVWQAHASTLSKVTGWKNRGSKQPTRGMSYRWAQVPDELLALAARLQEAEIENRPALDLIERFRTPDTLLYCDPPYLPSTRTQKLYAHEMTYHDHVELLNALVDHPGGVVISGYMNDLYATVLADWQIVTFKAPKVQAGADRMEVLWIKRP